MHELSLCEALVREVEALLRREGAARATRVTVSVGALSGVEPDALVFAFPLAAENTACTGAELVVARVPARLRCRACGATSETHTPWAACPACGSLETELSGGRDFLLTGLEAADT